MSFEKKLNLLEKIVKDMEEGELSLENSLKAFEEGIKLTRECQSQLNEAEQKVKVLLNMDADGNVKTEDFQIKG